MTDPDRRGLKHWLRRNWMRLYFAAAVLVISFGAGLVAAIYDTAPYQLLKDARAAIIDIRQNGIHYSRVEPSKHLFAARDEVRGVAMHDRARYMPGATLVAGMFDESLGFRLFDHSGRVLHTWKVSFNEIWPNATHIEEPHHDWDINIHGVHLFPNGDIVFNFEYEGTVRIDRHGRVVWKAPRKTHHSVYLDEDGGLWVPEVRQHDVRRSAFPGMQPPFYEDVLVRFDASTGKVLEEISLLQAIYDSQLEGLLFLSQHTPHNTHRDWLHINDIEVLPSAMAAAFPQFAPGDIMVSARNMNLVLLLDGKTHAVKWWRVGPWLRQHDPDFRADGKIVVFDNRRDRSKAQRFGASRVIAMDPATYEYEVLFAPQDWRDFYTPVLGKLQVLDNGNLLLTEAEAGRALEIGPEGNLIWEFVNRWDEKRVGLINDAIRYDVAELTFLSETS